MHQDKDPIVAHGLPITPPPVSPASAISPSTYVAQCSPLGGEVEALAAKKDEAVCTGQNEPEVDEIDQERKRTLTARQYQMDFYRVRMR